MIGQSQTIKTVIIGLDTTQFFSNAYYLDDLAKANMVEPKDVPRMFGLHLSGNMADYSYLDYTYEKAGFEETDSVRQEGRYGTILDISSNEYLGFIPLNKQQESLRNLIKRRSADYVVSINLYEILADTEDFKTGDIASHVIHYDLLDKNLRLVHSGKFEADTYEYGVYDLEWLYHDFALDLIFWIRTYESGEKDVFEQYQNEIDDYFRRGSSITRKNGIGLAAGGGMPYGGLGLEYSQLINDYWEWNFGAGWDFSGFNLGIGTRYYALGNQGKRTRPFAGLNFAFASGNKFTLGEEKDEFGTVINPLEVSKFKIYADLAIYATAGLNIKIDEELSIVPSVGYSFPFGRKAPTLLSGPEKEFRNNFAEFSAVGGVQIGITIIGYW